MSAQKQTYSVDRLLRNTAVTLVRDFRRNLNDPTFCLEFEREVKASNIVGIRSSVPATNETMSVAEFKATWQIANWFKRYRFEKDLFSDDELTEKSITTFRETQNRISAVRFDRLSFLTQSVIDCAKIYVAEVLGPYNDEEHRTLCRFGKRASVGIPSRLACEAQRWELPISGSQNQIEWFDSEMSGIGCVQDYWTDQKGSDLNRSTYHQIDSLALTLVPKTFKSLRSIMPNTTIGSYMSQGLGVMIRKRLKRKGYDISTLQERHKYLARRGSEHGVFVTADLSSASDSISNELVDILLPPDWSQVLQYGRIGHVELPDGSIVQSHTHCTMGIGYTFPLQTLVFLSLLKAILFVIHGKRMRATISVYGDDLIYIKSMHSTVVHVFEELGFVINVDKTFATGRFRESCGGDYYHGVDVRPFCPKDGPGTVGFNTYQAVLYKLVNGLLARWSEYEIEGTLLYLMSELGSITGKAKLVPSDYPDDSGIKVSLPCAYEFLRARSDVAWPKHVGHGVFRFSYLRLHPELRKEKRHEPYLWAALRDDDDSRNTRRILQGCDGIGGLRNLVDDPLSSYVPLLIWKADPHLTVRSKLTGQRLPRLNSFVTISHTGIYKRESGTSCFGVP